MLGFWTLPALADAMASWLKMPSLLPFDAEVAHSKLALRAARESVELLDGGEQTYPRMLLSIALDPLGRLVARLAEALSRLIAGRKRLKHRRGEVNP